MRRLILFILVFWTLLPSASQAQQPTLADINRSVNLMRKYCKSCHAVQPLKFIRSNNNVQVWQYILTAPAPSGGAWIDQIEQTLKWPSTTPPRDPFSAGRDYMPKGSKRFDIVEEKIGNLDAREYLYRQVRNARKFGY